MDIKMVVIETILRVLENEEVKEYLENNDDLSVLGINSVSFIEVVVILEKKFHIRFEKEDLDYKKFTSLEKLCRYISERVKTF